MAWMSVTIRHYVIHLAKFAQENRRSWDENLGAVVYSYNSAVQVCR